MSSVIVKENETLDSQVLSVRKSQRLLVSVNINLIIFLDISPDFIYMESGFFLVLI